MPSSPSATPTQSQQRSVRNTRNSSSNNGSISRSRGQGAAANHINPQAPATPTPDAAGDDRLLQPRNLNVNEPLNVPAFNGPATVDIIAASEELTGGSWWNWNTGKKRRAFNKAMAATVMDESKDIKNGNPTKRRIDLNSFAALMWSLIGFVCGGRRLLTRAKGLIHCLFQVSLFQFPELFGDETPQEARKFHEERSVQCLEVPENH